MRRYGVRPPLRYAATRLAPERVLLDRPVTSSMHEPTTSEERPVTGSLGDVRTITQLETVVKRQVFDNDTDDFLAPFGFCVIVHKSMDGSLFPALHASRVVLPSSRGSHGRLSDKRPGKGAGSIGIHHAVYPPYCMPDRRLESSCPLGFKRPPFPGPKPRPRPITV